MNTRVTIVGSLVLVATVFSPGPRAADGRATPLDVSAYEAQSQPTGRSQDQTSGRSGQPQQRSRLPWWKDPAVVKEIQLTPDQADRIDRIWHDRSKEMSGRWEEQQKQQSELDRLVSERKVSPDVIALQVDRVEAQRTMLAKSRTLMLYRMSLVLTAEQNKAFQAIVERNRRSDGRGR